MHHEAHEGHESFFVCFVPFGVKHETMSLAIPYRNTQESARPPLALIALLALIAAVLGVWVSTRSG